MTVARGRCYHPPMRERPRPWKLLLAAAVLLAGLVALSRLPARPPAPAAGADPMRLRVQGRFAEAAEIHRDRYRRSGATRDLQALLGVLEDTGDSRQVVREARAGLERHPGDARLQAILARGLLFAAATFPQDPERPAWIGEAKALSRELEARGHRDPDWPASLTLLQMQIAYLEQRWEEADALAERALELGTSPGESADVVALRFDLALRAGKLDEAEALLDRAAAIVEGWDMPSYYFLRTFLEEMLILREIYFSRPFTAADLDRLEARHRTLRAQGLVDPTLESDAEAAGAHESMRAWIAAREAGDTEAQLRLIEQALAQPPQHAPRCFYSEAVMSPFRAVYFHYLAGDLCRRLGRAAEARSHYEQALGAHPGDVLLQRRLQETGEGGETGAARQGPE